MLRRTRPLTPAYARQLVGLAVDFPLKSEDNLATAMRAWKAHTIAARQAGSLVTEKRLNQCKELFKKEYRRRKSKQCPDCGGAKAAASNRCQLCNRTNHYRRSLDETSFTLGPTKPRILPALSTALLNLANVGDSFVTKHCPQDIRHVASKFGVKITIRYLTIPTAARALYRVWRTDGLGSVAINRIIRQRTQQRA